MSEDKKIQRKKRFDKASDIFTEASKNVESVNLPVKPLTLFFLREALMNLIESSMSKRGLNPDNDEMLLYKCQESLQIIDELEKIIVEFSPNFEEFFRKSKTNVNSRDLDNKVTLN